MSMDLLTLVWCFLIVLLIIFNISLPYKYLFPSFIIEILTYGKTRKGVNTIRNYSSISKRWFTWFYLWGVIWNAIILYYYVSVHLFSQSTPLLKPLIFSLYIAFYPYQPQETTCCCTQQHLEVLLALILVCFQIGRRLYESLFITEFGSSKMHLLHFVYGVFFYTALGPAVLSHLSKFHSACDSSVSLESILNWYHMLGVIAFLWASWHQNKCHKILANLRKPNKDVHKIPYGDWFEYVSSPHLLAEVIIYFALFMVFGFSNYHFILVVVSTIVCLLLSARQTHEWYLKHFDNYPKRYVMFPWIY